MTTQITVPTLGESITEATVAKWFKAVGDAVAADEPLVELETDKVTLEINAAVSGTLSEIAAQEGTDVEVGALLGVIADGGAPAAKPAPKKAGKNAPEPAPAAAAPAAAPAASQEGAGRPEPTPALALAPAVRKLVVEHGLDAASIEATGKGGRLTKGDVLAHLEKGAGRPQPTPALEKGAGRPQPTPALEKGAGRPQPTPASAAVAPAPVAASAPAPPAARYPPRPAGPREERVRMTRLRKLVAARLKEAQNTAAMLTTFNEVDMTAIVELRARYKETFEKKHGVRIGFMSPFIKACVTALREFPAINAEIAGDDIIYKNYYDIGVAVGSPQGLVVPVVRDCDSLSFADIEKAISDFSMRARDGKLTIEEMQGGTFTITNGGIFGSMLSTPILNAPQSGILGMHNIVQRPMVMKDGSIQARPIMYLALSYDHRIVDGREAVSFLVRVKQCIEDPQRIMLDT